MKFFRKIRQNLLVQGRVTRYLLYAIGEIVLVVIGILFALQINNWNEQKIVTEKERHALTEIQSDLEINTTSLNKMLYHEVHGVEHYLQAFDIIIFNLEETQVYHDSLAIHFGELFSYPDLVLKYSGYESLTSIGMDLISDHQLRSEIGSFYTYRIPLAQMTFNYLRDDFYHYMLDYRNKSFITTHIENEAPDSENSGPDISVPLDYEALVLNQAFVESLKTYRSIFRSFKRESILMLAECEALHSEVENELKEQ